MAELDEQLRSLVIEACSYSPGNPKRQRALTQIIRLVAKKLWHDSSPNYQDALQQTWIYFCQNVCEGNTGAKYDPEQSSVITWLNFYLKRRLQDQFIETQKQQKIQARGQVRQSRSGEVEVIDPIETIAAEPDVPPILEAVRAWAEADETGELQQTHIAGYPQITCQMLILRRLPPETSWKDLAAEFGVSVSTLSSFYQRQCLVRLRNFGESEGYL